ncbi:hypothetical protein K7H91_00585 [Martelella mediterranea]|uniref:hypothetical protein n=1 Tax=Martelella mediterranea TaxID=293089 RepID=UPI001E2BBAB0|nr:hypothetical protein [Martelella mediterranea]MCD1632249.1 hypothetical protein [Martelella mediterranea]
MAASKGKVIKAYDSEFIALIGYTSANHPQQRVVAHRHHEAIGKGGSRSAAECQAKMVDDSFQPLSAPSIAGQHTAIELLAEYAPTAEDRIAPEPARDYRQLYTPTRKWKVSRSANISALNSRLARPQSGYLPKGVARP